MTIVILLFVESIGKGNQFIAKVHQMVHFHFVPYSNIVIDEITEGESRESLFAYVSNKFCYGTKAALQMSIRDMVNSYVFQVRINLFIFLTNIFIMEPYCLQYTLESFCEKRELCWTYEPYNGGCLYVDSLENNGSINGANCNMLALPENAWKVNVDEVKELELIAKSVQSTDDKTDNENEEPNGLFQNKAINVIVPGTVSVHSCHYCGGVGRKRCITCVGSGSVSTKILCKFTFNKLILTELK